MVETTLFVLLLGLFLGGVWQLWLHIASKSAKASVRLGAVVQVTDSYDDETCLRNSILDYFALASPELVTEVGVEADWLAAVLLGHDRDQRLKSLSFGEQAKVVELATRIVHLGRKLVDEGVLAYYVVTFKSQGPYQKINPPPSLFRLTQKGRAIVLGRRARQIEEEKV